MGRVSEHAHGTKGTADLDSRSATIEPGSGERWRYRGPRQDPYQQEHNDLFAAIRSGQPYNEAEYGALSTMTAILGRMATYSGKKIEFADAIKSDPNHFVLWSDNDADDPPQPDERQRLKSFAAARGIDQTLFDEAFGRESDNLTRGETAERIKSWLRART